MCILFTALRCVLGGGTRPLCKYRVCTAGLNGGHGAMLNLGRICDGILGANHYSIYESCKVDSLQDLFTVLYLMHFTR